MLPPKFVRTTLYERLMGSMWPEIMDDMNFVFGLDGRLDSERLSRALRLAISQDPLWGYRFVRRSWWPVWQRLTSDELRHLVEVREVTDVPAALRALYAEEVTAACRAIIFRTPSHDTLCLRFDHKLADGKSGLQFANRVRVFYGENAAAPAEDFTAPLTRVTLAGCFRQIGVKQRWQFLKERRAHRRRLAQCQFYVPDSLPGEPARDAHVLRFDAETTRALELAALRERATLPMLVQAAALLATREAFSLPHDIEIPLQTIVDLRRYFPPDAQPSSACLLLGGVHFWLNGRDCPTVRESLSQIRQGLNAQRGPLFGLSASGLGMELPALRHVLRCLPFWMIRRMSLKSVSQTRIPFPLFLSDLGELGEEFGTWGDRRVTIWETNALNAKQARFLIAMTMANFRSELLLVVNTGGTDVVFEKLIDRLTYHLHEFRQRPSVPAAAHTLEMAT